MERGSTQQSQEVGTGALADLANDPASRRRFLKMAGPGAAAAFSLLLAACGTSSDPQHKGQVKGEQAPMGGQDLEIVNFALTLEYLEENFYMRVVDSGIYSGKDADLFKLIYSNEQEHVTALEATAKKLGKAVAKPKFKFPQLGQGRLAVTRLAATFENTGASAYLGQATNIENRELLAAALSIHTVEGRHAAKLNRMLGRPFTPDGAFASPMSREDVLFAVAPYIV